MRRCWAWRMAPSLSCRERHGTISPPGARGEGRVGALSQPRGLPRVAQASAGQARYPWGVSIIESLKKLVDPIAARESAAELVRLREKAGPSEAGPPATFECRVCGHLGPEPDF